MSKESEDRFQKFAKAVRDYCLKLKLDIINQEYIKQMIRSSGSVSANYTEASHDLGKADEKMKLKISQREAKENYKMAGSFFDLWGYFFGTIENATD